MTGGGLGKAVRWPLWSWRNLTISAITVLALFAGLGRMTNGDGAPAASATTPREATPASSAQATQPPATSAEGTKSAPGATPTSTPTTAAPAPAKVSTSSPVEVATAFVTAWSNTDVGDESAWLTRMKPWASESLISSLSGTDPSQVPATRVTGDAALRSTRGASATVSVPTDGGRIAVAVVNARGRWRATTLAPDDAPPGAPTPTLGPASAPVTGG